ncbi:MAG: haloacid dehalogenase-like hydrolase [Selenomonas sp.]|uniref:haloacid dehalogenase-like hydrolase n=1 Tax=Selenomonas sp. TaxID=2053611 RepID=UPI0025DCCC5B|nr:HAD family hydrolase [Selenomonas sp.]MCR5758630.1 haloacid dehalogenase-like hydrolase [Selenomonas sp.]
MKKSLLKKKIIAALMAGAFVVGAFSAADAASREELAAIHVQTAADFQYWQKNAPSKEALVNYVQDITNPKSKNYIPPEDRIATFDLDGTLYCETAPYYFQEMMFLHRALEDKNYQATPAMVDIAKKVQPYIMNKQSIPKELGVEFAKQMRKSYAGMTKDEYSAYVKKFMETNEVGLTNLKRGEAYYMPMVEVVSYLQNNGFTVYMDSACEREILRCLVDGVLDIPVDHMIGSNVAYVSSGMGAEAPDKHFYDRHKEKVVRSDVFLGENGNCNKIFSILTEIGKRPVLAFGNSMGDSGMLEYNLQNDKYPTMSFFVLCDDTERELGNTAKAEKNKQFAQERGWQTISMKNEFKTIYGDKVKRTEK